MYSDSDIDGAVAAGAISREAATALRTYVASGQAAPAVDEEQFRLLTGFNDIFVTIAIGLLLLAVGQIGERITSAASGILIAGVSWTLAEYFTARRRMALPSIVLLLTFVGGVAAAVGAILFAKGDLADTTGTLDVAVTGVAAAIAAFVHWRRFMVPITVAAGAAAVVATIVALAIAAMPALKNAAWPILLVCGLAVFAVAMWWDMSDRERRTRRSDVAFWLHLVAAPMIAHPIFHMLGVFDGVIGIGTAIVVILLYVAFGFIALAIDRRALLVSGLAYVIYAMASLIRTAGAVELGWAFTALVVGAALLSLSAFWHPMRVRVVALLGGLAHRLPPTRTAVG